MNLTNNLASWRDVPPEQWLSKANTILPPVVVALLVVAIAYQAARLTLRLLEAPAAPTAVPALSGASPGSGQAGASSSTLEALRGWKPFGEPPALDAERRSEPLDDLPVTSLNLTLWGTNGANRDEAAAAIISSGGPTQMTYYVGETIENASGSVLHAVFPDRAVIDRGGRLETLPLDDEESGNSRGVRDAPRRTLAQTREPELPPNPAPNVREALTNAAVLLAENVNAQPHLEDGEMIGYRIQPMGNRDLFGELGFESGDVLTEVNGMRLDDPRNAAQVFQALGEANQAQVTVQRDGSQQALVIDIGQIENLMESQQ